MRQRLPRSPGLSLLRQPLRRCNPPRAPHRWLQRRYRLKKAFLAGLKTCLAPSRKQRQSPHPWHQPKPKSARVKRAATAVVNAVSRVASALSAANGVAVTAGAVAGAAAKAGLRAVLKDARKLAVKLAVKAVVESAANATLKAAAMRVGRSDRNVPPVKPARKAMRKAALKTANLAPKAVAANATAVTVVTAASALRVTRSSRTLQRPIRPRWLRPWVATPPAHRHVARTDRLPKPARTRVIARKLSARKATANRVVTASPVARAVVNVVAAATTAAVNGSRARTPRLTR